MNFEIHGAVYTYNNETKSLEAANVTLDEYVDATGNREKIITHANLTDIGFAEIITYVDANSHKVYQNIPKVEKCTVTDVPDLNLTDVIVRMSDKNGNITEYLGRKNLEWVTDIDFYAFKVTYGGAVQTVYFCTRCLEPKFVTIEDQPYIFNTPKGIQERWFTDADFDHADCTPTESQNLIPFKSVFFWSWRFKKAHCINALIEMN